MPLAEPTRSAYRAEIDGLRAFAVLSVVTYHAFPEFLPGGFTGVDVFFVISGYLITAHIFASLDEGRFSFLEFFGKRIRRIFPALILVMASGLVFGWLALLSEELQQLGKHVASGAAFFINFVLVGESGYFDTEADLKPMLHLWSLAVEEQFYIVWPLVLWLAWKMRFNLIWITVLVGAASFYFNVRYASTHPTEIFFWPFGRFWELLSGSALAWFMLYERESLECLKARVDAFVGRMVPSGISPRKLAPTENIMGIGGLFLLLYGFVAINPDLPFPSTWALVPVCGTILVIAAGATAWSNRIFMMNPIAVLFGLISYPLYLWHWPILSFLQIVEGGELAHRDARIAAVVLAVILAWLTVRFIERPLRFGSSNARLKIAGLAGAMICVGLTGLVIGRAEYAQVRSPEDLFIQRPNAEHIYGPSPNWFQGSDGWLFLGNAHDNTVAKLKLAHPIDPERIAEEVGIFAAIAEAGLVSNTSVALLIGPNKSTVYPEFLPAEIEPSEARYVTFFTEQLETVSNLTVIDPASDLREAKDPLELLYFRTDTHWNYRGALRAFSTMADRMGWPVPDVTFSPGEPDLGDLVEISQLEDVPVTTGDNWLIEWGNAPYLRIEPLRNRPESVFGSTEIVTNMAPLSDKTVWVIGDSFTDALRPFINATFKEVHYLGHWDTEFRTLPEALLEAQTKPDLVLIIRVERSF